MLSIFRGIYSKDTTLTMLILGSTAFIPWMWKLTGQTQFDLPIESGYPDRDCIDCMVRMHHPMQIIGVNPSQVVPPCGAMTLLPIIRTLYISTNSTITRITNNDIFDIPRRLIALFKYSSECMKSEMNQDDLGRRHFKERSAWYHCLFKSLSPVSI